MSSTITQSYTATSFETTTMKLKIAAQKPDPDDRDSAGRATFLQALPKPDQKKTDNENAYANQRYSPSFCRILSEKSLELCTENLGCETGSSDTMDDADILSLSNISPRYEKSPSSSSSSLSSSSSSSRKSENVMRSFPPPLTSMSNGRSSLQIRPRREEGRLVITAVAAPENPPPCFLMERRDGRLTMTMTEYQEDAEVDSSVNQEMMESETAADDEVASEVEEGCEESAEVDCDFLSDEDYYYYHGLDEDDDDHDEESGAFKSGDLNANIFDAEVELGIEKFQRLIKSRCNDRWPKGLLCNWGHLWVATS